MKKFYYQLLTVVCLLLMADGALAQPGAPAVAFGNNGKIGLLQPGAVTYPWTVGGGMPASPLTVDIKIQPDRKILVLAMLDSIIGNYGGESNGYQYYLYRLNPDGTYDNSFGTNGNTPLVNNQRPVSLELLPNGKILVGAQHATPYALAAGIEFALSRYNANGTPDNTFGTGGTTFTSFDSCVSAIPVALFVLPNGKLIQGGCGGNPGTFQLLVRYNANGTMDPTYGINGRMAIRRSDMDNYLCSRGALCGLGAITMVRQSTDKIVAAWSDSYLQPTKFSLARYNANGTVDASFGTNGMIQNPVSYNTVRSVCGGTTQPDDKMLFVSTYFQTFRFNADGSLDSSFASPQLIPYNFYYGSPYMAKIILQPDKKLSILYNANGAGGNYSGVYAMSTYIARLNSNGIPDSVFGKYGDIPFGQYKNDFPGMYHLLVKDAYTGLALDSSGTYVLAGHRYLVNNTNLDSGIVIRLFNDSRGIYHNDIRGNIFYDKNQDGVQNTGEHIVNNMSVTAIKTGDTVRNWNMQGIFNFEVDTGTYKTQVNPARPYFNIVPVSKTTSHSTYFNTDTVSFALQPIAGKKDLAVSIVPVRPIFRVGWPPQYKLVYENAGTETIASGTVTFIKPSNFNSFNSDVTPDYVSGDTLRWNFNILEPLSVRSVMIDLWPAYLYWGMNICVQAQVEPVVGDLDTANNQASYCEMAFGPYDPNDITEAHGGKIALSKATTGEYLTYTVRFQNTGNDTAFNVYIHDTLDSKLNWNSMQVISSSHNYQVIINDGKCIFHFPFIKLVDSIHNEPKSHGYITYRIKPKSNVQIGDLIKSKAFIYFDYNLPVKTNIDTTMVIADALPLKLLSFTAKKQEKTNLLDWKTSQEINLDRFEIERSNNSRAFSKIGIVKAGLNTYSFIDSKPLVATNYYRLKMMDKDGQFTYSPIRQINSNQSTLNIAIYPNPAKDNLQVEVESDKKATLQLLVLSTDGKVLLSKKIAVNEGSSLQIINISALPKGSYLLKLTTDNVEQVVKFEKL